MRARRLRRRAARWRHARWALLAAALACAPADRQASAGGRVLWAWDRPEDLRFLAAQRTEVAVFESAVDIDRAGEVTVRPRQHAMKIGEHVAVIGVVRLDLAPGVWLAPAAERVAQAVLAYHRVERTSGLQVDFDARRSERDFYRHLLAALRARLPARHGLSITALASWCLGDRWLDGLPIDEAVPMLFRMGPEAADIRRHLDAGGDFSEPLCRRSVGLSTDEPWPRLPDGRRRYLFHPRPWTASAFGAALAR